MWVRNSTRRARGQRIRALRDVDGARPACAVASAPRQAGRRGMMATVNTRSALLRTGARLVASLLFVLAGVTLLLPYVTYRAEFPAAEGSASVQAKVVYDGLAPLRDGHGATVAVQEPGEA